MIATERFWRIPLAMSFLAPSRKARQNGHKLSTQDRSERDRGHAAAYNFVDLETRGFCARRQFSDVITYSVYFRMRDGQQRFYKIGRHGVFTSTLARNEAKHVLRNVAVGKDPGAELKALRHGPTITELCDDYAKDMQSGKVNGKKESTIKSDLTRIKTHIRPALGKLKVASVTRDQIEAFMHGLSPGSAKRIVSLLSAIFTFAVKKKLRADNPCHGIEKPKDVVKLRRLSNIEYAELGAALNGGAPKLDRTVADIILMSAVTGWRSSEVKNLRWSEVDIERCIATLGDTKTGVSIRPLSSAAIEIIKRQSAKNGEFVFEYQRGKSIANIAPHWIKIGLPKDVTPHTLRHSFASLAGDMGLADSTIARLLGHSQSSVTSRYIHMEKSVIEASDLVAQETLKLMRS
jgi:integrase